MNPQSPRSLRRAYLEWVEEQVEEFKDVIPRSRLLDIADANRTFYNWIGTTRVDTAVNRNWALFAELFYYDYRFAGAPVVPATLTSSMTRQGLRWGLALWKPLR